MQKQAASNILERYVELAERELKQTHQNYNFSDLEKVAVRLINADIERASLFDKVAQCEAMGRSLAQVLIRNVKR